MPNELTEREKNILRYIIQQFILTASPVGSNNIAKKYQLGISPATVRNIMFDLEESGFIGHPHTSAGRIPTDKGYRVYVDSLMDLEKISQLEKAKIHKSLLNEEIDKEEILKSASKLLSSITKQLAYVSYPKVDSAILQKIQIISLSQNRILIVISIKSGLVRTITLEVNADLNEDTLSSTESFLNEKLGGLSFKEIKSSFKERVASFSDENETIIRLFVDSLDKIFVTERKPDDILLTGAKDIIKQPEFEALERFQSVIELIEDKNIIIHIIEKSTININDNVFISIGKENANEKLSDYSFVSKEYSMGDIKGNLGVIGPKRMDYSRIISIIDYMSKMLTDLLR